MKIVDVGVVLLDERDPFRRRDDADHAGVAGARVAEESSAATALPPVASMGSIIRTKLWLRSAGSFEVGPRRDRGQLVALEADVPHARGGDELEDRVQHPQPGAQDRDDDDVAR